MRMKIIVISTLFLLFAIIAVQNVKTVEFNFLFWPVDAPLIIMLVVIFILGLVIGLIFSSNYERKKRKQETTIQPKKEGNDPKSNSSLTK
ncbi:MAG: DUF1049 domain-containing protein [Ignavibacteriota bacterium]|nr:MAG: DUF1049 domain-containing protein [Chlorobiota bacterium]MBE7476077.1 DUF1049 domain-containing protein [Ignavibacteriales bacterium]MBL1124068.1 DUF1049 domain-containing protein [Ignavibacteriota bacterium]MCC7094458.1 DUF1049 domain-containing protein [Ignavibacteriaceae bacterium]MCE7856662.1 DUF1049 domain-containing protein [Ignavibacteria bacterium CHB3]MEB2295327.1 LapA family protein [Ignavibacteria bacterium]